MYVRGSGCECITFNICQIFERMEIAESIYEGVLVNYALYRACKM